MLTRKTPMARASTWSGRRTVRFTGAPPDVVEVVVERDQHSCVRCGGAVRGRRGLFWVLHHRRPRGIGGTKRYDANSAANLIVLCSDCHWHIESHRTDAITGGWLVGQLDDPATVACLVDHGSRYVYLTDCGEYSDNPPDVMA